MRAKAERAFQSAATKPSRAGRLGQHCVFAPDIAVSILAQPSRAGRLFICNSMNNITFIGLQREPCAGNNTGAKRDSATLFLSCKNMEIALARTGGIWRLTSLPRVTSPMGRQNLPL